MPTEDKNTSKPCGATQYFGSRHEEDGSVEFVCKRPAGHEPPHRDRSPKDGPYTTADSYEWWPETWWTDDDLANDHYVTKEDLL